MGFGSASTISAIAAISPAAMAVLEKYRIDYYCAGNRVFGEVCQEQGLSPAELESEIANAVRATGDAVTDWNTAPLKELIRHIVSTHHELLKLELPRVRQHLNNARQLQASTDAGPLDGLQRIFSSFARELDLHMQKEETVLFPLIERYEATLTNGTPLPVLPFGSIRNPIAMMEAEHANTDVDLRNIRELTHNVTRPACASEMVCNLLDELRSIEVDLHVHMHLENNILFPRAIAMESMR